MTDSSQTSSRRRTLSLPSPPPLSSPSSVVETIVVVIVIIVAAARCLHPIRLRTSPCVTLPPLQVLDDALRDEVQHDVDGRGQLVVYVAFGFPFGPNLVDGYRLTHQQRGPEVQDAVLAQVPRRHCRADPVDNVCPRHNRLFQLLSLCS
jgi:hypothetical protein